MVALRENYADFQAAGASLVAISPQLQTYSQELVKDRRLPFEVLSDAGNTVAATFGIAISLPESIRRVYADAFKIDLPTYNGDDSWSLPMPARFIVDQHGVVQAADVNLDHKVRPEPASVLDVLKNL
ncbi:MAG: redoxin domain-containing protein [Desulfobacterales bacterium]|nr:redoxin domain-containing protein [Desulfobacterales bacterium]